MAPACGFAWLSIVSVMLSLAHDRVLAGEVGGLLALLVCLILIVRAVLENARAHAGTEPARAAGSGLCDCYLTYARRAAFIAAWLLAGSLALQLLGDPRL